MINFTNYKEHSGYSSYLVVDTTCSSQWLLLLSKGVKALQVHAGIFVCALKLAICAKGVLCYLRKRSALTYLGWG